MKQCNHQYLCLWILGWNKISKIRDKSFLDGHGMCTLVLRIHSLTIIARISYTKYIYHKMMTEHISLHHSLYRFPSPLLKLLIANFVHLFQIKPTQCPFLFRWDYIGATVHKWEQCFYFSVYNVSNLYSWPLMRFKESSKPQSWNIFKTLPAYLN